MDVMSVANLATSMQSAQLSSQIGYAVAGKAMDAQRQQGAAALQLLQSASQIGPGDIAGNYAGVTAGGAVGVGGNANALVGGSDNSIALQPVSIEGQVGLNVAVGVAGLELRYGR